jgi:hypothetical protein
VAFRSCGDCIDETELFSNKQNCVDGGAKFGAPMAKLPDLLADFWPPFNSVSGVLRRPAE